LLRVSDPKHEKPDGFEVETRKSSRQEDDPPAIILLQ
jgi:hypothetical protein